MEDEIKQEKAIEELHRMVDAYAAYYMGGKLRGSIDSWPEVRPMGEWIEDFLIYLSTE